MSYQTTNEDIKNTFISARNLLNKGVLFLFDIWYGPGVLTDLPSVRVKKVSTNKYDITRIANPTMYADLNRVDVKYDFIIEDLSTNLMIKKEEIHSMSCYFKPEIEELLNQTGFELIYHIDDRKLMESDYSS